MAHETVRRVVDPEHPDAAAIEEAAAILRAGGLVAFPTETVYGLGAHALDPRAVARIFAAKERPATDPLIVHLHDAVDLDRVARDVPAVARALAAAFWPGPLTLIVPKGAAVPDAVTAGLDAVAVRVPAHPVAQALLAAAGVPVAAPSANRFSRPSPTRAEHVLADLDGRIDLLLDAGPTAIGVESTIVDTTVVPPIVRRAGGIAIEALHAVVETTAAIDRVAGEHGVQVAPGQLLRHYAPAARLTVFEGDRPAVAARLGAEIRTAVAAGWRVGVLAPEEYLTALAPMVAATASAGRVVVRSLGLARTPATAAHVLFDALRGLDAEGVDVIVAAAPERTGLGMAVWDRLRRAAEGRVVRV